MIKLILFEKTSAATELSAKYCLQSVVYITTIIEKREKRSHSRIIIIIKRRRIILVITRRYVISMCYNKFAKTTKLNDKELKTKRYFCLIS